MEDAPVIFERWAQDAEVARYMTWRPHESVAGVNAFLDHCRTMRQANEALSWVLTLKGESQPIGMLTARFGSHGVELGYVLGRAYWNRGYMTEAARAVIEWALSQPEIHRVWAVCDVDNAASAKVLEKVGMRREGVLRRWIIHPNIGPLPRDCYCYAIIK